MVAAHLSVQLHVSTAEVSHFDAALGKPAHFFLALLILSCNFLGLIPKSLFRHLYLLEIPNMARK